MFAHKWLLVVKKSTSDRLDGFGKVCYQSHCTNIYFSVSNMQAVVSGIVIHFCIGTKSAFQNIYVDAAGHFLDILWLEPVGLIFNKRPVSIKQSLSGKI